MKKAPARSAGPPEPQRTATTQTTQLGYAYIMSSLNGMELNDPYLPEMRKGRYAIKHIRHAKGEVLDVINTRTSYFSRASPLKMTLQHKWSELLLEHDGERFRSSHPNELIAIKYATDHAHGDVLVCGLGIGLMLHTLETNVRVESITCVEGDGELIDLLSGYFTGVKFIHEETLTYLKHTEARYDFIYMDAGYDSISAFYDRVAPFRKMVKDLLKPSSGINDISCWHEEVVRGQIMENIYTAIAMKFDIGALSDEDLATRRTYSMAEMDFFTMFGVVVPDEKTHELVATFVKEWEL